MKKNRSKLRMTNGLTPDKWGVLHQYACTPQQMQQIKGGNCCDEGEGGETPPPPPAAMGLMMPTKLWQA
ncbi:hypothetical protein [Microscilla marina]|uniref:hypothetical protein n=1 Tax=Microscilla marina TaxID=1027 RepID=UPI0012FCF2E0|nr:hypothetical protein [Microscilla marina]